MAGIPSQVATIMVVALGLFAMKAVDVYLEMSRRRWDDEQKSSLRRQEAASAFIAAAVATVQRCAAAGAAGSWSIEPGAHVAIFEMRARGVSEGLLTEAESILDVLITGTRDDGFDAELAMRLLRRFADDVGCAHSPSPD